MPDEQQLNLRSGGCSRAFDLGLEGRSCASRVARIECGLNAMPGVRESSVNLALIPVAASILYPAFGILLSPIFAALAMALSSVSVLTNALRLKRVTPPLTAACGEDSATSAIAEKEKPP